ncbi:hypothetical protein RRG08_053452 [Elysia crispata]|uniref:Uncharacterized protein n=1 Tax=Elysia crispata TaxID=231223 RepID=A0AAE0XNF3_9GAST|nr:hypothetical protein RRG08_053452 [Elysia crispata]
MHSIQPPAPKFHVNQTSFVPSTLATAKATRDCIDRLKTAYVTPLTIEENKEVLISLKSILTDNLKPTPVTPPAVSPQKYGPIKTTRAGRISRVPSRFC